MIILGYRTQVDLNIYSIITMEKVFSAFTNSEYETKMIVYDYDRSQDVLIEARDQIAKVFEDLR